MRWRFTAARPFVCVCVCEGSQGDPPSSCKRIHEGLRRAGASGGHLVRPAGRAEPAALAHDLTGRDRRLFLLRSVF